MNEQVKVGGRPSQYPNTDKEKHGLFDKIFECAKEGRSLTEIALAIGIGRTTLYRWMDEIPEFRDTIKDAQAISQAWWEDLGRKMAMTGEGNATVFIFQMKNRFHKYYKDRKAIDMTSSDGTMGPQQVIYQLPDNGRGPDNLSPLGIGGGLPPAGRLSKGHPPLNTACDKSLQNTPRGSNSLYY